MGSLNELKQRLQQLIDAIAADIIDLADRIHANPEIAYTEFKASKWLSEYLEEKGFHVTRGIAGLETAFQAVLRGAQEKPAIAFLAEYDALAKIGHGCGHNLIGAASVGAAAGLAGIIAEIPGTVMLFGTPAEEGGSARGGGGKIPIVEHGFFKNVDAVLMFHPSDETIMLRGSLGRIYFKVEFFGRSAHAASRPTQGINALDAMISFFVSVGLLRQQLRDDIRIHGVITDGGTAPNIIPDHTAASFYVRGLNKKYNMEVVEKVMNCARGAALATGTEVKFEMHPLVYEPKLQNAVLAKLFMENLKTFDVGEIKEFRHPMLGGIGSSDIGNVSQVVPTFNPMVKITDAPGHSPEFARAAVSELAHQRLIITAKSLAMSALDLFMMPDKVKEAWEEFIKTRGED
jgi:amidohydrolase